MITLIYMTFSNVEVYETSAQGNKLAKIKNISNANPTSTSIIELLPSKTYQTITGFGGSFTQSSAYLFGKLSAENQQEIIDRYFGPDGAQYSLTRTHINSCDFSLHHYSYANEEVDGSLSNFSISQDLEYLVPMIKKAMSTSREGFKIIASPWTAPPWMKDNKHWVGGKLLPQYEGTWARYIAKFINAYSKEGIPIWGITVENEPHGNDNNWESMHFTPKEMAQFVIRHLRPILDEHVDESIKILGFDQNRDKLEEWANELYGDFESSKSFDGLAVHWYASTYKIFSKALTYAHEKAPKKHLIQTEACIDAQAPAWKDDQWYWSKNATDWGWNWAPEEKRHLHPKYVPVFRYARDIIGCLNNWVDGWIDWNMVLNRQGGPNWAQNWCTAPVIVDEDSDEVYYTPLYYTMAHFSRFIRPGAQRISIRQTDPTLWVTATKEENSKYVIVILNQGNETKTFTICMNAFRSDITISRKALQTIELSL